MIGPGDAKRRSLVVLPDGKVGRLVFCPPAASDDSVPWSVPDSGRGASRGRKSAIVRAGGSIPGIETFFEESISVKA
jgi:hypothetical protein